MKTAIPIYVDLDGTLSLTDTLLESIMKIIKLYPLLIFKIPLWIFKGKAYFKFKISELSIPDSTSLPYNQTVLDFIKNQHKLGRPIVLATGANYAIANSIADSLKLFSSVIASDSHNNLTGKRKLDAIIKSAPNQKFDYIGDSFEDLPIFSKANIAYLVSSNPRLKRALKNHSNIVYISKQSSHPLIVTILKAIRIHQWSKNLLIFLPIILSHRLTSPSLVINSMIAFFIFCLAASTIYIFNDLIDLESDRNHIKKKHRPFASGELSIKTGWILMAIFFTASLSLAFFFSTPLYIGVVFIYILFTITYSLLLKNIVIVDVICLAGLYCLRIFAGSTATGIAISEWLFAFSLFIFLNLALLKRYSELRLVQYQNSGVNQARGYWLEDLELLRSFGPVSGYISVLVFALYINSPDVLLLYNKPHLLWLIGPILLYWITRAWFLAHRGRIDDDPVSFAIRDSRSYLAALLIIGIMLLAK